MERTFTKMHGAGNDYIYFNCLSESIHNPETLAVRLSDRHFGIGGDGIILICPSDKADAKMRMFNADGSEGKMCGNAIRCVGKYLYDNGIVEKKSLEIETLSGIKKLELNTQGDRVRSVRVDMGKADFSPGSIPVLLDGGAVINRETKIGGKKYFITCVSMGNPHCVIFVENVDAIHIETVGPEFENAPVFPDRVNTEFVRVVDGKTLKMRVWERGSGETFACGTGACASVAAAVANGFCGRDEDIRVILRGGDLTVRYTEETVFMTGNAEKVFEGVVNI